MPLIASTNTTRPTSEPTYLANRPSRRNQILSLTATIQILVGRAARTTPGPFTAARPHPATSVQTSGRPRLRDPGGKELGRSGLRPKPGHGRLGPFIF